MGRAVLQAAALRLPIRAIAAIAVLAVEIVDIIKSPREPPTPLREPPMLGSRGTEAVWSETLCR